VWKSQGRRFHPQAAGVTPGLRVLILQPLLKQRHRNADTGKKNAKKREETAGQEE